MEFNPFCGKHGSGASDYNDLSNKPSINGVTLTGNQFSNNLNIIDSKTTAEWNSDPTIISQKNMIYIYTDYDEIEGQKIPAMKIGDGNAYLIDLPFTGIGNVTQEQINYWNNKVSVYVNDEEDTEQLIFTKENI